MGRRYLVATIHVYAGLALPLPFLVGWVRSAALRADVRRLNRFRPSDWRWLRSSDRRSGRIPVGKFNAGQKLNGAFTLGAILVMLMTGSVMHWTGWFPLSWRTGATFVHDWLAFTVAVVVLGHIYMALERPGRPARHAHRLGAAVVGHARARSLGPGRDGGRRGSAGRVVAGRPGTAARSRSRTPPPRSTR